jgi:hypothetical protein
MPYLHKKIIDTVDEKQLTALSVSLTEEEIMRREALIRAPADSSLSLFNTVEQFNLNIRLESIGGNYHGSTFHWLRLF